MKYLEKTTHYKVYGSLRHLILLPILFMLVFFLFVFKVLPLYTINQ